MADRVEIDTRSLAAFRRSIKRADREVAKELTGWLRDVGRYVAQDAASVAPRDSGTLAAGYKPIVSGSRVLIRNRVPYAGWIEFGGTISPRGAPIQLEGRHPVGKAIERNEERIVHDVDDAIGRAAKRIGWH